jgi:hypothetical protein
VRLVGPAVADLGERHLRKADHAVLRQEGLHQFERVGVDRDLVVVIGIDDVLAAVGLLQPQVAVRGVDGNAARGQRDQLDGDGGKAGGDTELAVSITFFIVIW